MLTLGDLWESLTGRRPAGADSVFLSSVEIDSRQCVRGSVFIALAGERQDGNLYVDDALARGAVAVIAEARARGQGLGGNLTIIDVAGLQPDPGPAPAPVVFIVESSLVALQRFAGLYRRKFSSLTVVGVTGSVGKSSTKELIYSVLQQRFATLKSEGNLNNEIGVPLTLFKLNERHRRAVLEMGMYALGEIRTLCEIAQPRIGVVTNVLPVHLQRLGSIENIARAKGELPESLPAEGAAVLNGDDPRVWAMRDRTPARVLLYGLDPSNDIWADEIEGHGLEGIEFNLHYQDRQLRMRVPLLGQHSVHNVLAATAVGLVEGLSWAEIVSGMKDASAQLRLLAVRGKNGITILDDTYNASPTSVLAALNLLNDLSGRKVAVLGDMLELGEYESEGHRLVGIRAAQVADIVVAVGPLGSMIGQAAQEMGHRNTYLADDNAQASHLIEEHAQPGDVVLVKGSRGAHMEDIVSQLAEQDGEDEG